MLALIFAINTLFNLYIGLVIIRFLLQIVRADFYNPLSQLVVKLTNPGLIPLRKIIPGIMGIDFAAMILIMFLETVKLTLLLTLQGKIINFNTTVLTKLFLVAGLNNISMLLDIYMFIIMLVVIFSWFSFANQSIMQLAEQIINPYLKIIRKIIPVIQGFDFSPMAAMFVLTMVKLIFVEYATKLVSV